ncbi:hypothetical protein H4R24_004807 [Coemansia sp. RSA 988]|nr:hypothetical protein H4R24_004807 [Coemansia sp. RSA 988]
MPTSRSHRKSDKVNSQKQTGDGGVQNTTTEQPTTVRRRGRPSGPKHKSIQTYFASVSVKSENKDAETPENRSLQSTAVKPTEKSATEAPAAPEAMVGNTSKVTEAAVAAPRKRGRPSTRKNPSITAASASKPAAPRIPMSVEPPIAMDPFIPDAVSPRKRGRPRKNAAQLPVIQQQPVAPRIPESVDPFIPDAVSPRKRGRPRKNAAQLPVIQQQPVAPRIPESVDPFIPDAVSPRKRGRPRKNAAHLPATQQQSVDPQISKSVEPPISDAMDPPILDAASPRKRGISCKTAAQLPATPRKRGRQQSSTTKAAAKRRATDSDDSGSAYLDGDEPSTHESDMQLDSGPHTPLVASPRKKERMTTKIFKSQSTRVVEDDYTIVSNYRSKKGRPTLGSAKVQRAQVEALWMGPSAQGATEHINPNYIDIGLDSNTWSWLRSVRVDADSVVILSSAAVGRSPNAAEAENMAVTATMGGADHPQHMRRLDVHQLAGPTPGWAVNTGEHVAALDWAPAAPPGNSIDYLASAGMGQTPAGGLGTLLTRRERTPQPGSICLWRIATQASPPTCRLDMQLSHTFGPCLALRWCPVGINPANTTMPGAPVVGVLAAVFGDGMLRVLPVPVPNSLRQQQATLSLPADDLDVLPVDPVRMQWPEVSLAELRPLKGVVTALTWATSDILVAGTSRGVLMVWELSGVVCAQQQKHNGHPWHYTQLSNYSATSQTPNSAPIVCQQLHFGPIVSVSTYICGSSAETPFAQGRDDQGFRRVSPTDVQIVTLGADGRLRQTHLALPTRLSVPLASIVRSTSIGCVYWPMGTCLFVEKNLRILNNVLEISDDPWLSRDSSTVTAAATHHWNQLSDHSSHHILQLECPLMNVGVSDMHGYLALARSDGTLVLTNLLSFGLRGITLHSRVIYRVLSNKDSGLVWLPRESPQPRPPGVIKTTSTVFNLYPPEIAVITAVWSRNPKSAHWIATTSACGILRIEDVSR